MQALQKDVDKMTSELGVDSSMSVHLTTVACDKTAERIHVAIAAVRNDLARIHRRISEGGVTKATVRRRHKISVGSSTTGYAISPLSPKTPLPTSSPRWPLQHSKPSQLSPLRDPRQTGDTDKRRFFGDDWNRTLAPVGLARDVSRQKGSQRTQGTFLAS